MKKIKLHNIFTEEVCVVGLSVLIAIIIGGLLLYCVITVQEANKNNCIEACESLNKEYFEFQNVNDHPEECWCIDKDISKQIY